MLWLSPSISAASLKPLLPRKKLRKHNYDDPPLRDSRFDKDSPHAWLQGDIVKRISARKCGWGRCDAVMGSEDSLARHVKKRHLNEGLLKKVS